MAFSYELYVALVFSIVFASFLISSIIYSLTRDREPFWYAIGYLAFAVSVVVIYNLKVAFNPRSLALFRALVLLFTTWVSASVLIPYLYKKDLPGPGWRKFHRIFLRFLMLLAVAYAVFVHLFWMHKYEEYAFISGFVWDRVTLYSIVGVSVYALLLLFRYSHPYAFTLMFAYLVVVLTQAVPLDENPSFHIYMLLPEALLFAFPAFDLIKSTINFFHYEMSMVKTEIDEVLAFVERIGGIVVRSLDMEVVTREVIDALVSSLRADAGAVFLIDERRNELYPVALHGIFPPLIETPDYIFSREKFIIEKFMGDRIKLGETPVGIVAQTGEPLLIPDALSDSRVFQSAPGILEIKTLIAAPLKVLNKVFGVVILINKIGGRFTSEDLRLLRTMSSVASMSIQGAIMSKELLEKQRAEQELSVAADIQRKLLPQTSPDVSGMQLAFYFKPARGVGGDYYDFIQLPSSKVGVTMVDVAGKGVPAALVMVMIRSVLRTLAPSYDSTSQVVSRLNDILSRELSSDRYATMFYYTFDPVTHRVKYTNAGHGPAIFYSPSTGELRRLDTEGFPVGIVEGSFYGENEVVVREGDILVLYTDGITEAMNEDHELFGEENLIEVIKSNASLSAQEIKTRIVQAVGFFVGDAPQHDDMTLVVAKFVGSPEAE